MLAGDRILTVNHAGEYGAICIYSGQLLASKLRAPALLAELKVSRSDEIRHLNIFADELRKRGLSRCRSYFLCGAGGLVLGLITRLLGPRAIAQTTASVERVVLTHLSNQLELLAETDPEAHSAISLIVADEQAHFDEAMRQLSSPQDIQSWLSRAVAAATESVIWIGMRL